MGIKGGILGICKTPVLWHGLISFSRQCLTMQSGICHHTQLFFFNYLYVNSYNKGLKIKHKMDLPTFTLSHVKEGVIYC